MNNVATIFYVQFLCDDNPCNGLALLVLPGFH